MHGYHGCYLRVRLDDGSAERKPLEESVLRRFLGGVGLGTWLLARESPARLDPFDPQAPLLFVFSPLVGTPLTTSAKFAVIAKSPLTNRLNDALASSHFALAGKRAGMDALVVIGACPRPSVLIVDDDRVRVETAEDLWGSPCSVTEETLRQRLGPRFQFAVIGPAGENLVRFATISHGNRHAGRGGLGAVMGAKKLKAIAVAGTRRVTLAEPEGVVVAARDLSARSFGPATAKYRELGTLANLLVFNRLAVLPTRNFQNSTFEQAEALSPERSLAGLEGFSRSLAGKRKVRESCAACTIGCEHIYPTQQGGVRLEYETAFALGPLCGIGDSDVILRAARYCDEQGLDTISAGATIAFAMECAERGWLDAPHLRFGRRESLVQTLADIVHRRGLGDRLAEGSRRLAEDLGPQALAIAPQVKGLEMPGYEPRGLQTMALGLAVASRGADHNRSGAYEADFSPEVDRLHGSSDSVRHAIETEDRAALLDSLILCKFLRGVFSDLWSESAELLQLVTGWDVTAEELRTTARRIVTAKKLYNLREGWTADEDTLPGRFLSEPLTDGVSAGARLSPDRLAEMIRAYYQGRNWDETGRVPRATISQLHLDDFPMFRRDRIGGIVLCGGRSTRMGKSKAHLMFGNETLLQRIVRILKQVVEPVVVVAAPAQHLPQLPADVEVVRDQEEGLGPLSGLLGGLKALVGKADAAFVSSCDVPFLQPAYIRRVLADLAYASVVIPEVEGRLHPLAAAYGIECLSAAQQLLRERRLRPVFLCDLMPTRRLNAQQIAEVDPQLLSLRNVNTPDEYEQALRLAQHSKPASNAP